ncbi:MAG TPA: ankyrin repeat domain-containing protein [Verrucomicrobiae bacterium]|nr:ankyrin repeat domain-containing protein [Verrucomicrobiae bacterium]
MNIKIRVRAIRSLVLTLCFCSGAGFAATNEISALVSKGLFEEEANRDLDAAIRMYRSAVDHFDTDRNLAATALFRLGECYRKQGNSNDALIQYQRVLKEFPDQAPLVVLSRQNMAALGSPETASQAARAATNSSETADNPVDAAELSRVEAVIKNSPDLVNAPDATGRTLLETYAAKGNLDAVKLLLDNGAVVNGTRQTGLAPLHFAAGNGHKAVVDLLLKKGANTNVKTERGVTPLHLAVWRGYELVAMDLLKAGAQVNAAVTQNGSSESDLLKYDVREGQTPLHLACLRNYDRIARELIAKGADVSAQDLDSRTPLSITSQARDLDMSKALLDAHADPNKGRPLALAAGDGDIPMMRLLTASGADPNAGSPTPLQEAVWNKRPESVRELLANKTDPSLHSANKIPASLGQDPVIFDALSDEATLKALLEGGANANQTNRSGQTPLLLVLARSQADYARVAEILLAHGADPNIAEPDGFTPLHAAGQHGDSAVINALIEKGARVNAQLPSGLTPLYLAVRNRMLEATASLLDHGADPNLVDQNGTSPLDLVKGQSNGPVPGGIGRVPPSQSFEELLRAHGASDDLPRTDRIEVRRGPYGGSPVFTRSKDDSNRFTLLELLAAHYGFISTRQDNGNIGSYGISGTLVGSLSFPDLERINIRHPAKDRKSWATRVVSLQPLLDSGDCSSDVFLGWGDQVEIPETDHPLNQAWQGFSERAFTNLAHCLKRTVTLTVKGDTAALILDPGKRRPENRANSVNFYLAPVLLGSGRLRASSDVSHVKVTRHNNAIGENWERTFDCSGGNMQYPNLWLRDGDAIEVPDKP